MSVPRRYVVVRAIAFVLKLLAWLALLGGVLAAVGALLLTNNAPGSLSNVMTIIRSAGLIAGPVVGIVWFVQLFAFGSILSLLVHIEENTRTLAMQMPAAGATADQH